MSTLSIVQDLLVAEFGLTHEQVAPEAKLEDLGIDSLATLELLFKLEDQFGLDLNGEPTPVVTVADIVSEVDRLTAIKTPATP